jgi:hypothetical protein
MITVVYDNVQKVAVNCHLKDLCPSFNDGIYPSNIRKVFGSAQITSFIGKCGYGPEDCLYIVGYSDICLAENPQVMCWSSRDCNVVINEVVDVEIKVVPRKQQ